MLTRIALSADGTRAFTVRGELEWGPTLTLTVHDLTPGSAARVLGQLEVELSGPGSHDYPVLSNGDTLLVGAGSDLVQIDVSNTRRPTVASRIRLGLTMAADAFAVRDNLLFVAAAEDGMQVFVLSRR